MSKEIYETLWETGWEDARYYGPIARHSRRIINKMTLDLNITSVLDVGCGECSLLSSITENHYPSATVVTLWDSPIRSFVLRI